MAVLPTSSSLQQHLSLTKFPSSNRSASRIIRCLERLQVLPTRLLLLHQIPSPRPFQLCIRSTAIDPEVVLFILYSRLAASQIFVKCRSIGEVL